MGPVEGLIVSKFKCVNGKDHISRVTYARNFARLSVSRAFRDSTSFAPPGHFK